MRYCPNFKEFLSNVRGRSYHVFSEEKGKLYNLNIVGWRNKNGRVDKFDDYIAVYWMEKGCWKNYFWPASTMPGLPWLLNPMLKSGTAVLVPGQYLGVYKMGLYKKYTSLKQVGPVNIYRDANRDSVINKRSATIESGIFGIHIHAAGLWSRVVGLSSAGCQVFQKRRDFFDFMTLCGAASIYWGESFTYTLMEF